MAKKRKVDESPIAEVPAPVPTPSGPSFLPTDIIQPLADLTRAKIWIYGPPKIGKTTLAAHFPGVWFWATESGHNWLSGVHKPTTINSWPDFLQLCSWVHENRPTKFPDGAPIRTIVIDVVDLLYKMCSSYVCEQMGISSPADEEYGKGWSAVNDEFARVICKIMRWDEYGFVFVSHSSEKQIKSKGSQVDRIQPDTGAGGLRIIHKSCDLILYCFVDEVPEIVNGEITGKIIEERVIRCAPKNNVIAGDRTGLLPPEIPLSYESLVSFFDETPKE